MKITQLLLLLLFSISGIGQDLQSFELKPGVYKTVYDVMDNNPMQYDKLEVLKHKQGEKDKARHYNIPTFRLDLTEEESDELGHIFGFSDGKYLYLHNSRPTYNGSTWFYKAETIDPFIYYETVDSGEYGLIIKKCVIDRGKRKFYRKFLNNQMRKVLSDKPGLKEKFNKQKQKWDHFRDYLIEYSKK